MAYHASHSGRDPLVSLSRDAAHGAELMTPLSRSKHAREPSLLTRSDGEGVAETPSPSPRSGMIPEADDEAVMCLAKDPKESAESQRVLPLQARSREELQTSTHATIRTELESVKLAEQRAAIQSRAGMAATLGTQNDPLNRSHAELEMYSSRASTETNSLITTVS